MILALDYTEIGIVHRGQRRYQARGPQLSKYGTKLSKYGKISGVWFPSLSMGGIEYIWKTSTDPSLVLTALGPRAAPAGRPDSPQG
eukprot:4767977-Prymnesium_polylepis.1